MLKRDIPELILFFDLEWIPDAAAAVRLYDLPPDTSEAEAMDVLWKKSRSFSEETPRPFLKYLVSKIVSIAFLSRKIVYRDGERRIEFSLNSLPKLPIGEPVDEAYLIERFLYIIGEREPQLVGYNSCESDLQVLIQRALINEVSAPAFNRRPEKPWEGRDYFARSEEWHFDILRYFSRNSMAPQLNEIARLCGFPGKLDVDGQQVPDLWLSGDLQSIVEYNRIDTLNTYLVWLRLVYFAGRLKEDEYVSELDEFRMFLDAEAEKEESEYIARFLEKWDSE